MPELIVGLSRQVAACLPEGARSRSWPTRALAVPRIVAPAARWAGTSSLRLQGPNRVRTSDGHECSATDLAPKPGSHWWARRRSQEGPAGEPAQVAGLLGAEPGRPRLLVSDRPDGGRFVRRYPNGLDRGTVPGRKDQGFP